MKLAISVLDKISVVANTTHIHQQLIEILSTSNNQLYAGRDLYQVPPIHRKPVFEEFKNHAHNLCHPWSVFKMIEPTENVRQRDDQSFTELLNRFRTGSQTESDIQCIQSSLVNMTDTDYPVHALHIFAENAAVDQRNSKLLEHLTTPLHRLPEVSIDQLLQNKILIEC